ncbi:MAG: phage tail tape measure protein, partial [Gammaproteobacteria bacterium]
MPAAVKAGQAYVALGVKDGLKKGFATARKKLERFGRAVASIGKKLFFIGSTITTAFLAAARAFATFGDSIGKTASRLGISIKALQELHFAAGLGSIATETLNNSLRRMIRRMAEAAKGTGAAVKAFKELKLDPKQLKLLPVEQQLGMIGDALNKVGNHSDKLRLAFQIFDTEGAQMLSMLSKGSAGLAEMAAEAQKLGVVLSDDAVRDAELFSDAWGVLKLQLAGVVNQIGATVVPILVSIIDAIKPIITSIIDWVKANKELVQNVMLWGAAFAAAGAVFIAVGAIIGAFILAFIALKVAIVAPLALLAKFVFAKVIFKQVKKAVWGLAETLWGLKKSLAVVGRSFGGKFLGRMLSPFKKLGSFLKGFFTKKLFSGLSAAAEGAKNLFYAFFGNIVKFSSGAGKHFKNMWELLVVTGTTRMTAFFKTLYGMVGGTALSWSKSFLMALGVSLAGAEAILAGFAGYITAGFKGVWAVIKFVAGGVGYLAKALFDVGAAIVSFGKGMADLIGITFIIKSIGSLIYNAFAYIGKSFASVFSQAGPIIVSVFSSVFTKVSGVVSTFIGGSISALKSFGGFISTAFIGFFNIVKDGFMGLANGWHNLLSNMGSNLGTLFSNIGANFATMFGGITDAIMSGE